MTSSTKKPQQTPLTAGAFKFASPSLNKGKARADGERKPTIAFGLANAPLKSLKYGQKSIGGIKADRDARGEGNANSEMDARQDDRATPLRSINDLGETSTSHKTLSSIMKIKQEGDYERSIMATPKKLTSLTAINTPWSKQSPLSTFVKVEDGDISISSKKRRLGDVSFTVPDHRSDRKEDLGRMVALRQLEGVKVEEGELVERSKIEKIELEKEVGIGISPRKGKVKWTGKGDPPLSLRLANLLTAQSSSLALFYTSLSHSTPQISSHRVPQPKLTQGTNALNVMGQIRSAPIRFILLRPLEVRQHNAQLWLCKVKKWGKRKRKMLIKSSEDSDEEEEEDPKDVVVNFGGKGESVKVGGLDIKVLTGRWRENPDFCESTDEVDYDMMGDQSEDVQRGTRKRLEAGVWSEWCDIDVPIRLLGGEGQDNPNGLSSVKVLFATRYLIAETHG